ncbi:hypothetical protein [Nocardiopsis sp. MG754419]|uniref:hypothetical protein n=1 Tax=Nocardiopsis sp. MG754419 TaxID=2259865 RepID=UPI001BADA5DF|nr:hypothetical protein [Nocardiopsis sp. MG754419]MBR8745333.1 hypothetical protein [Nocardiopsis sp. MG754419]
MGDNVSGFEHISTDDLRERAVDLARQRWDVRFFWKLLGLIPAAEAAAGNTNASEASVAQASGLLYEALSAESDPNVQEAMRPVYIQYLVDHDAAPETQNQNE